MKCNKCGSKRIQEDWICIDCDASWSPKKNETPEEMIQEVLDYIGIKERTAFMFWLGKKKEFGPVCSKLEHILTQLKCLQKETSR